MTVTYGAGWHRRLGTVTTDLTADQARTLHEARERYVAVLLEDEGRPVVVLEVVGVPPMVTVHFLDGERRVAVTHQFVSHSDGGDLRITQTSDRQLDGRRTVGNDWYGFDEDGTVFRRVRTPEDPRTRVYREQFDLADYPDLRASFPAFGQYDAIARPGRRIPTIGDDATPIEVV